MKKMKKCKTKNPHNSKNKTRGEIYRQPIFKGEEWHQRRIKGEASAAAATAAAAGGYHRYWKTGTN